MSCNWEGGALLLSSSRRFPLLWHLLALINESSAIACSKGKQKEGKPNFLQHTLADLRDPMATLWSDNQKVGGEGKEGKNEISPVVHSCSSLQLDHIRFKKQHDRDSKQ